MFIENKPNHVALQFRYVSEKNNFKQIYIFFFATIIIMITFYNNDIYSKVITNIIIEKEIITLFLNVIFILCH